MRFLTTSLKELGLTVVPSEANFVMLPLPSADHATRLTQELLTQGIIVRPLGSFGLPNCIRISTGTAEDNERCVQSIHQAIQKFEVPLSCNS
jgi:histidinol-phosphate aminotransferase